MLRNSKYEKSIGAVMVLYKPDWSITSKAIEKFSPQIDLLCIVDNTPGTDNSSYLSEYTNIHYLPLGKNKGIAAAQNIGVSYLKKLHIEFVLFCDQDSLAPSDTVKKLLNGYQILKNEGIKVATIGTRAINKQSGEKYKSRTRELGIPPELKYTNQSKDIIECYSIMSSISLTPIINFQEVGSFDESLFIDGVDDEWCWRAWHARHLRSFINEDATIMHMLGENDHYFLGKKISISSPFRIYYQFRNFLILTRRDTTPEFWKRNNLFKFFIKMIYYPLFVSPRLSYLKKILCGIKDGLKNKKER